MNRTNGTALVLAAVGVVGLAIGMSQLGSARPAAAALAERPESASGTYQVDPVHASVVFRVKHMGASNFYGRLNSVAGTFSLGDTASFDVTVKADSVYTGNPKRDDHVKSPDFFSAAEFPDMKCVGKDFKKAGEGAWKGTGSLTFHGVTKPVELTVTQTGSGKGREGEIAGIETSFTFKRSEFGSKGLIGPVSDEVMVIVALEGGSK